MNQFIGVGQMTRNFSQVFGLTNIVSPLHILMINIGTRLIGDIQLKH